MKTLCSLALIAVILAAMPSVAFAAPTQGYEYEGTLEYGDEVYEVVNTLQGDIWYFYATAGDIVQITMYADEMDTLLRLLDPSGDEVAYNDDYSTTNESIIVDYEIEETGRYSINADGYGSWTGSYYLSLFADDSSSSGNGNSGQTGGEAYIDNVSVEYDGGMYYISFNLQVDNMLGRDIVITMWPVDASSGDPMRPNTTASQYVDSNGRLYTYEIKTPSYESSYWESYTLTIPFSAFPHSTGEVEWYPYIGVRDGDSGETIGFLPADDIVVSNGEVVYNSNQGSSGSSSGNNGCQSDSDCDGITDSYELYIAESFFPVYEFDEEEHNPITDQSGIYENRDVMFLWQVSPVLCGTAYNDTWGILPYLDPLDTTEYVPSSILNGTSYLLTVVAAYAYDYLPYDPVSGGEEDLFNHYGDTERVRLCITDNGDTLELDFLLINRHHELGMYLGSEVDIVGGANVYLYVSEGKHATFISNDECKGSVSAAQIFSDPLDMESWQGLGWEEDCGSEGLQDDNLSRVIYPRVDETLNVGEYEPGQTVLTWDWTNETLADVFPGEAIWGRGTGVFCGGYDYQDILAYYDFSDEHEVVPNLYTSPVCGGTIDSKWWKGIDTFDWEDGISVQ